MASSQSAPPPPSGLLRYADDFSSGALRLLAGVPEALLRGGGGAGAAT